MLDIGESNPLKPVRVMIYGVEGVGKSSFGAKATTPIFITPEGGIDQLGAKYLKHMDSWDAVKTGITSLINEKHDFKTLVIDSADWLEKLCHAKIIGNSGRSIITVGSGYGHGYRQAEIMHRELIDLLSQLRDKRHMNIIVTAHAHVKPVKDPSMLADYDAFEIKTNEMVSSLWREYVDALFFVRFRTFTRTEEGANKARAISDGSRVIYTQKQPSFQAKNRFGMAPEYDFTPDFWDKFVGIIRQPTGLGEIKAGIFAMIEQLPPGEVREKAWAATETATTIAALIKIRERINELKA